MLRTRDLRYLIFIPAVLLLSACPRPLYLTPPAELPATAPDGYRSVSVSEQQTTSTRVGGRDRSWTESHFYRSNLYLATRTVVIAEYQTYLELPPNGCALGFFVFASPTRTGPYAQVWSSQAYRSGTGYHSSGPVQVATTPGVYYALGVGWECPASYFSSHYGQFTGVDVGLGPLEGNTWSNHYSGFSPTFTPEGSDFGETANYDQVVTIMR